MRSDAATLRLATVPQDGVLIDSLVVCLGTCLIAGSAQLSISLPFTPVPVTGQTFAVLLVGAGLGTARGGMSALLYLALGVAGVPIYAHGGAGLAAISGAGGGYLVSFPVASALTGFLAERRWDRRFSSAVGAMLMGNIVIYLIGLPWLSLVLHANLDRTLQLGLYPFVPGDMVKLYLAAALLPACWHLAKSGRAG